MPAARIGDLAADARPAAARARRRSAQPGGGVHGADPRQRRVRRDRRFPCRRQLRRPASRCRPRRGPASLRRWAPSGSRSRRCARRGSRWRSPASWRSLLAALLANIVGATWDDWSPEDRATFEPVGTGLVGQLVLMIVLPVLGVKAATSEYGSGMIRTTLIATPRRWRVLLAKAGIVAGVSAGTTLVATIGMLLVSRVVLRPRTTSDGADLLGPRHAARARRRHRHGAAVPVARPGPRLRSAEHRRRGHERARVCCSCPGIVGSSCCRRRGRTGSSATCPAPPRTASRSRTSTPSTTPSTSCPRC